MRFSVVQQLYGDYLVGVAVQKRDRIDEKDLQTALKHNKWNISTRGQVSVQCIAFENRIQSQSGEKGGVV